MTSFRSAPLLCTYTRSIASSRSLDGVQSPQAGERYGEERRRRVTGARRAQDCDVRGSPGERRRPERAGRRLWPAGTGHVRALFRVSVLVAEVLAGERRQLVEDAAGAVSVHPADAQLLR